MWVLTSDSPSRSIMIIVVRVVNAKMMFMHRIYMFARLASLNNFSNRCTIGMEANPNINSSMQIPAKLSLAV